MFENCYTICHNSSYRIGLFGSKKVFHERVSFFYLQQIFGQPLHRYRIHSTIPAKASDRLTYSLLHSTNACNACKAKLIAFLSAILVKGFAVIASILNFMMAFEANHQRFAATCCHLLIHKAHILRQEDDQSPHCVCSRFDCDFRRHRVRPTYSNAMALPQSGLQVAFSSHALPSLAVPYRCLL